MRMFRKIAVLVVLGMFVSASLLVTVQVRDSEVPTTETPMVGFGGTGLKSMDDENNPNSIDGSETSSDVDERSSNIDPKSAPKNQKKESHFCPGAPPSDGGMKRRPDSARDGNGTLHKVWQEPIDGQAEICYANNAGRGREGNMGLGNDWNPSLRISNTPTDSVWPEIEIDPISGVIFILWTEELPEGDVKEYTMSRDGGARWSVPHIVGEGILLKADIFYPPSDKPEIPQELTLEKSQGYYLVHLSFPIIQEWYDEMTALGAKFYRYIPHNAFVVSMSEQTEGQVEALPFVTWVGLYHPAYKVDGNVVNRVGEIELNVIVFARNANSVSEVMQQIGALGGTAWNAGDGPFVIRARIDASKVIDIAFIPDVEWVEEFVEPSDDMNIIRGFTGASTLAAAGFNGEGIVGEVMDNGIDQNHQDFVGQILAVDGNPNVANHGTATFGIIFGSGAGNANAVGMLPAAQGVFVDRNNVGLYQSVQNLVNNWGGLFQSNSWGGALDCTYGAGTSAARDQAVFDFDITVLTSMGNSQGGIALSNCRRDSAAKNVIAVGGVNHQDTAILSDDTWNTPAPRRPASQGPTVDGRIKPDLSGPYDWILTTDSNVLTTDLGEVQAGQLDGYVPGSPYFNNFGGTSGATPVVAGAVGLTYQMYIANHFGNNPSGLPPHASTVKALLIADAHQYDLARATRFQQGWGMVDVGRVHEVGDKHLIVDGDLSLQVGDQASYQLGVLSTQPLKISLVWTDVFGSSAPTQILVNDLDLKVTSPDGTVYWGNNGLQTALWSTPGGLPDNLNNVENVFIENPTKGRWTIEIVASAVNQDGNPNTPGQLDQTFALVASYEPMVGGEVIWEAQYDGGPTGDLANDIATDGSTVYVTGESRGDYLTIAYDAITGVEKWPFPARYDGPSSGWDVAMAIALAPDGSKVYVTGYSSVSTGSTDYVTLAYNAMTGGFLWEKRYDGPGGAFDRAYDIAVAPDGSNVYVTGESSGGATGYDYATLAYYAATGIEAWPAAVRYDDPSGYGDEALGLVVTDSSVFVTGESWGDFLTIAYDAETGVEKWPNPARYDGPVGEADRAYNIAISPDESMLYVAGWSESDPGGAITNPDYTIVAYYTETGAEVWPEAVQFAGSLGGFDHPRGIAVAPDGLMVFVTGYAAFVGAGNDYLTLAIWT